MDHRILNFANSELKIPDDFSGVVNKRLIYACGDGVRNSDNKTNIQRGTEAGYSIFCCMGMEPTNIAYLIAHPQLNIVLCILTGVKERDYAVLEELFENMLTEINTDDTRFYPSAKTCFTMLNKNGICNNILISHHVTGYIDVNGKIYPEDLQWGMPNFELLESAGDSRFARFRKNADEFQPQAKFQNVRPLNTSRNEKIARQLMQQYVRASQRASNSWAEWHTRQAKKGGTRKKHNKSRKRKI
jgi:hypothetical protein